MAAVQTVSMDKIVSLSRRRGFVFPSSEIYGGLGSTYDYGHYGVLLKNNIKARWFETMILERDDIVALDSAVILQPRVWEASGHVEGFTDPLVDCRTCKLRFRADKLDDSESRCGRKPSKHPGETPDCDLTEPRQFNLMFETTVGPVQDAGSRTYLRPETAQGIFINFKNVLQLARRRPPFGIAQIGKSFRNEITPGNFLFRVREFEQMEMEYFVPPAEAEQWYRYWIDERVSWYLRYGVRRSLMRVREHGPDERSHYSRGTSDIEYLYPIGWGELEGVANRGDYDLTRHTEFSTTKLEYVGPDGERYVPYVIEPAVSLERIIVAMLADGYDEEVVGERERTVLRLHPQIAPVTAAILPLIARDEGMVSKARSLYHELRKRHSVEYDDNGAIGRRYRRQDEIGTPWAFTIDEQTLADDTVTVRDRDSLAQERLALAGVRAWLDEALEREWRTPKGD
jgi:glycyl-tRNA synthetase